MLPEIGDFSDPESYLRQRRGGAFQPWKEWAEQRAIDRCLAGVPTLGAVCDCPCGPGRLFDYWGRRGLTIVGVDRSEPMVEAAREALAGLGVPGRIVCGDVNDLARLLPEPPDLVACVRFLYYFGADHRRELLQILASASRRFVLLQYKTLDTWKGRRRSQRQSAHGKFMLTHAQIELELAAAGLALERLQPIGTFSDRVFVLAARADGCA